MMTTTTKKEEEDNHPVKVTQSKQKSTDLFDQLSHHVHLLERQLMKKDAANKRLQQQLMKLSTDNSGINSNDGKNNNHFHNRFDEEDDCWDPEIAAEASEWDDQVFPLFDEKRIDMEDFLFTDNDQAITNATINDLQKQKQVAENDKETATKVMFTQWKETQAALESVQQSETKLKEQLYKAEKLIETKDKEIHELQLEVFWLSSENNNASSAAAAKKKDDDDASKKKKKTIKTTIANDKNLVTSKTMTSSNPQNLQRIGVTMSRNGGDDDNNNNGYSTSHLTFLESFHRKGISSNNDSSEDVDDDQVPTPPRRNSNRVSLPLRHKLLLNDEQTSHREDGFQARNTTSYPGIQKPRSSRMTKEGNEENQPPQNRNILLPRMMKGGEFPRKKRALKPRTGNKTSTTTMSMTSSRFKLFPKMREAAEDNDNASLLDSNWKKQLYEA